MKPTDIPGGHRPHPVLVTGITLDLPIGTALVDRDGDEWTVTGRNQDGEALVACPSPADPEDAGEGPSYPWTLTAVRNWFGPLTKREDPQQMALAAVDTWFDEVYGPYCLSWQRWQWEQYEAAVVETLARFIAAGVAA